MLSVFDIFQGIKNVIIGKLKQFYENFSIYAYLERMFHRDRSKDIDTAGVYIIASLFLTIILMLVYCFIPWISLFWFFLKAILLSVCFLLSFYRLLDIFMYYFNTIIFEQERGDIFVANCSRTFFYAILNFIEIILYFAVINFNLRFLDILRFKGITQHSFLDSLYFTIVTVITLGYGDIRPETSWDKLFVLTQLGYTSIILFFIIPIFASVIRLKDKEKK